MEYVIPQLRIFQQLEEVDTSGTGVRRAVVIGPNFDVKKYEGATAAAKALLNLGAYAQGVAESYTWPDRPAGGIVDTGWTKLFVENAWLKYWSSPSSLTIPATGDANRVTGSFNFVSFSSYDRDATFINRDVKVGDGVRISGTGTDAQAYDIETRITGFENNVIASTVGTSAAYAGNQANTTAAASESQIDGYDNAVEALADEASYDGRADGYVEETYVVEVIQGGAGSGARLRVTSASGTDNQSSVVPSAFGTPTAIGSRGLEVTWDISGTTPLPSDDIEDEEFVVGQTWEFTVSQDYTIPAHSEGGTYTGPSDTTYIVEVLTGGDLTSGVASERPRIVVSTSTGIDLGGPYTVATGVAQALGAYGVTITFTGSSLVAGDRFSIAVTAEADGAVQTITMADAMPDELLGQSVAVDLYIRDDYEITERRIDGTSDLHFTQTATEISVVDDVEIYDSTWTDVSGELEALPLYKGDLYVQYRALSQTYGSRLTLFGVDDIPADVSPDDPFFYGLYKALTNSNGTEVFGVSVQTNDVAGYRVALGKIGEEIEAYAIVPMTKDSAVRAAVIAHVNAYSTPEVGRWRRGIFNSNAEDTVGVYTNSDSYTGGEDALLATIADDPSTSGTQYTKVYVTGGEFLTAGVLAGDILRVNYTVDAFGDPTYEEYTVDRVVSEDTLLLVSGPAADIPIASKIEIWRELDLDTVAENFGMLSSSIGNRKFIHLWPDYVTADGGQVVDGFYLCAAIAGFRSGVESNRPMTNVEITGFEDVPRSVEYFDDGQLNIMAAAGTWIVTKDENSGRIYTRHQLTTGDYNDINQREDSVTTNLDAISYELLNEFDSLIGTSNISPGLLDILRQRLVKKSDEFLEYSDNLVGPRALSVNIAELRQHTVLQDRIVARLEIEQPKPFNNMDLTIVSS